jgi:hypothetical protein
MTVYDYQIGLTSGSMAKLENLTLTSGSVVTSVPVDYPKSTMKPYADSIPLVSGLVRGIGYPTATWIWSVIPQNQRDALRQFCPGQSANVYIRTKTMDNADVYANYSAVMIWPTLEEERDASRRMNLKITFKTMVLIT